MSSRLHLLLTLSLFGGFFSAFNWAVDTLSRNSIPRQTIRRVSNTVHPAEVVALGDSRVFAGFDPAAFEEGSGQTGNGRTVNGGMGATGPIEHLLIGRAAMAAHPRLHTLIYGCQDTIPTRPSHADWSGFLGNSALSLYQEPVIVSRYLDQNPANQLLFRIAANIPVLRERGTLWLRVEDLRRRLGGLGMPAEAQNSLGRVEDFNLLLRGGDELAKETTEAVSSGLPLAGAIEDLLQEAMNRGIRMVVVMMPKHPENQANLQTEAWRRYQNYVRSLFAARGVPVIDASSWTTNAALFMDRVHLNPEGAVEFSRFLGREIQTLR